MEVPTLSKTLKPPDLNEESLDPGIMIALFEIGSIPPVSCSSLPSLKSSDHEATEQRIAKKFESLLKEIKDIVKHVTSYEQKVTETKEPFKETNMFEVSELREKIIELDEINKELVKKLLASLDLGKKENAKKQEMRLDNQNSEDTVQDCSGDLVNCSKGQKALPETQLSKEKAKHGFPHIQEENIRLRNNMERLLQEAEHWSVEHTELSKLIKSYQKSQNDIKTLKNNGTHSPTQTNNESAKQELEEQVKRLKEDTYSLHLIATLLENECQILEQRVELLDELHHPKEEPLQGEPMQINHEQSDKEQKLPEAEKVKIHEKNMPEVEGTFHKRDQFFTSLDICHNKKAHNNQFNTHIAKRALVVKRPASSLS
ncbi:spermatogenic leucine zipper protein 1 [Bos mutus]|uniref:Spermatogenic leucine zipper protein 1 n=2 Tax=Bos TaxID=9903 RepID=L8HY76_9CETA|nr:PREDICTED: spermatogenic leucine zipper protein 1 [Bos mutus]ELR49185.1 Spermatogenic leucine zipper protein 1 [Bos mutus]